MYVRDMGRPRQVGGAGGGGTAAGRGRTCFCGPDSKLRTVSVGAPLPCSCDSLMFAVDMHGHKRAPEGSVFWFFDG